MICVEGDEGNNSCAFTLKLQSSAEGLGKQNEHELKYYSLGGGHLNQLFVAMEDGVPCAYPNVSSDGRMSKDKVGGKHGAWKDAQEQGL